MKLFPSGLKPAKPALAAIMALMLFIAWTPHVSAHSLYIQSARYHASSGKALPLFFCYGHYVPVADGIRGKKLNRVNVIEPDGSATPVQVRNETGLHSYMVDYNIPGIWTLTAQTTPGYFTSFTDKKGKERHAIKPIFKIKDRAKSVEKSYYSKQYAKTYVNCGKFSGPMPPAAGLALELVPLKNIFTLKSGDNLALEILSNGQPFKGKGTWDATYLGFSTVAEDNFYPKNRVEGSRLSIPLPNSGRWFIRYFIKIPAPEKDQDKYLEMKLTATLTFQIDNERKTPKGTGH
jgi:uncharacterized GH25 family protein